MAQSPPATPPPQWYEHPYVKIVHAVLTAVLAASLIGAFSAYLGLRDQVAGNRQQLAVLCSKIDLVYMVVVEKPLTQGEPTP